MSHQHRVIALVLCLGMAGLGAGILPVGLYRLRNPYRPTVGWVDFWETKLRLRIPGEMGWTIFRAH